MKPRFYSRIGSWLVFLVLTAIIGGVILASQFLIDYLRKEETRRIQLFAKAMKYQQEENLDPAALDLILEISNSNTTIPVIVTDASGNPLGEDMMKNIPADAMRDPQKIQQLLAKMKKTYPPFIISLPEGNQYVYYNNSLLLNALRYTPIYLSIIGLGYLIFTFWFLSTVKKTDEGFLWAGLAKETAHQIGTPLSSMIGWIEILRMESPENEAANEIEKDIDRLTTITERFSKIGSVPEINDLNLSETISQNYDYLKRRISAKIDFQLHMPADEILVPHSRILMSWVIENLVKNAVDAMKGSGVLKIIISSKNNKIFIDFTDSGCGMSRRQARSVFRPGFTTKKRGWGLGLSLARRVINEYHKGELKVLQTEIGKGTTFRIVLRIR